MNKKIRLAEAKRILDGFNVTDLGPGHGNGGMIRSCHNFRLGDLRLRLTTKIIDGETWATEYTVCDDENTKNRVGSQCFGALDKAVRYLLNGRFQRTVLRNILGRSIIIEVEIIHVGRDFRRKAFVLMKSFADPFGCDVEAMSQKMEAIRLEKAVHANSEEPEFVAMVESVMAGTCAENAFVDKFIDMAGESAEACFRHAGNVIVRRPAEEWTS